MVGMDSTKVAGTGEKEAGRREMDGAGARMIGTERTGYINGRGTPTPLPLLVLLVPVVELELGKTQPCQAS